MYLEVITWHSNPVGEQNAVDSVDIRNVRSNKITLKENLVSLITGEARLRTIKDLWSCQLSVSFEERLSGSSAISCVTAQTS